MEVLTLSQAKAGFCRLTRRVIQERKPVIVRTPSGFVQIAPYDLPEEIPPVLRGSLKLSRKELRLHNTFGESL